MATRGDVQLYPYFNSTTISDDQLRAEVGTNIKEYIDTPSNYKPNMPFYDGLFRGKSASNLFKTIYGLFLFQDNYHDFTDTARIDTNLLYLPIDDRVDNFYIGVVRYTTEDWFFRLYMSFDEVIRENMRGDRKEDTIIRLFLLNGGETLWNALFPGDDHAFKRELLKQFFLTKMFMSSAIPFIRIIKQADLETIKSSDIKTDFFFEFRMDKTNISDRSREAFGSIFHKIISDKPYVSYRPNEKIPVTCDATSFPYRYMGFNKFIDIFSPKASAQTLWDGAQMDTFDGALEYDSTDSRFNSLKSLRSNRWSVKFNKKENENKNDSTYYIDMSYNSSNIIPTLNNRYILSTGKKGFTVKHMFYHAAYLKYILDYYALPITDQVKRGLATHIGKIFTIIANDSRNKGKNHVIPPLLNVNTLSGSGGHVMATELRNLLLVPIDGKGSCDADQAIYAGLRDYGFTTIDALCYFSGILNRANSSYIVSSTGRISMAKFIKDPTKLLEQHAEFERNKIRIQFKEMFNYFIQSRHYLQSIAYSYRLLASDRAVRYKSDNADVPLIGTIMRLYYLHRLSVNRDLLEEMAASTNIQTAVLTSMQVLFQAVGMNVNRITDIERNMDALFRILQERNIFAAPVNSHIYDIYVAVNHCMGTDTMSIRPADECKVVDLFATLYLAIDKYIGKFMGKIVYSKGQNEIVAIDTFTVMDIIKTKDEYMQYFIIGGEKRQLADSNCSLYIGPFLDKIDDIEASMKRLMAGSGRPFGRAGISICDGILDTVRKMTGASFTVNYEGGGTVRDAMLQLIDNMNQYMERTLAPTIRPLIDGRIGGAAGSRKSRSRSMPASGDYSSVLKSVITRINRKKTEDEKMTSLINNVNMIGNTFDEMYGDNSFYGYSANVIILYVLSLVLVSDMVDVTGSTPTTIPISVDADVTTATDDNISVADVEMDGGDIDSPEYSVIMELRRAANMISYNLYEYTLNCTDRNITNTENILKSLIKNLRLPELDEYVRGHGIDVAITGLLALFNSTSSANKSLRFKRSDFYDIESTITSVEKDISDGIERLRRLVTISYNEAYICEGRVPLSPGRGTRRKRSESRSVEKATTRRTRRKKTEGDNTAR
jgi:hypothetical protein